MLGENVSAGFIPSVWDELKQTMFISSGYPSRCSSRIKTEYPSIGVFRLRVVSNFVDGDCGAGKIHTHARAKFRGDATRGKHRIGLIFVRACVRVYLARPIIAIAKISDHSQSMVYFVRLDGQSVMCPSLCKMYYEKHNQTN